MVNKLSTLSPSDRMVLCVFLLAGSILIFMLLILFKSISWIIILELLSVVAWLVFCSRGPLSAFLIVLIIFVLAYARLGLSYIPVEGPGNRGTVALGDLLWFGLIIGGIYRQALSKISTIIRLAYPLSVWFMFPFVAMATLLPVLGVITGNWPLSYMIPGLRQIQWVSFAFIGYYLCLKYGIYPVLKGTLTVIVFAGGAHLIYSLIQLGYSQGVLNRAWILFDDLFTANKPHSWFYYPRLTGLLVNPNSYGLYGAFLLVMVTALTLVRASNPKRIMWWIAIISALLAMVFSASRSALLGLGVAFILFGFLMLIDHRLLIRGFSLCGAFLCIGTVNAVAMWPIIPSILQDRFTRFFNVFSQGAMTDVNALARVNEWSKLWDLYLRDYPFGTWVPTSYATGSAVDSFYMVTIVQGTPVFTFMWIVFIMAAIYLGWQAYRRAGNHLGASVGLTLIGWAGVMAGSALTLSPMLQPQLISLFWTFIGISIAIVRGLSFNENKDASV